MKTQTHSTSVSRLWTGRVVSTLAIAFLALDGIMKLFKPEPVIKATVQLGYSEGSIVPIGIVLLVCVLLHLIPRTAMLGAVLLTGYLGGAVASQARIGEPLFSHVLFPVYVAILIWGGLWLRDEELNQFVPLRWRNPEVQQDEVSSANSSQRQSA